MTTDPTATGLTADDAQRGEQLAARVPDLYDRYMDAVRERDRWLVERDAQSWDVPAPEGVRKVHRAELGRQTTMGSQAVTRAIRKGRQRLGLDADPPPPPADADYVGPREVTRATGRPTVEQLADQLANRSRTQLARQLAELLADAEPAQ